MRPGFEDVENVTLIPRTPPGERASPSRRLPHPLRPMVERTSRTSCHRPSSPLLHAWVTVHHTCRQYSSLLTVRTTCVVPAGSREVHAGAEPAAFASAGPDDAVSDTTRRPASAPARE